MLSELFLKTVCHIKAVQNPDRRLRSRRRRACSTETLLDHTDTEIKIFGYRYFIYMASGAKIRYVLIFNYLKFV